MGLSEKRRPWCPLPSPMQMQLIGCLNPHPSNPNRRADAGMPELNSLASAGAQHTPRAGSQAKS